MKTISIILAAISVTLLSYGQNYVLPSASEPGIMIIDSVSGYDTLVYYNPISYNVIGTLATVGFDLDSIAGDGCKFGVGGSMFGHDFKLGSEWIEYDAAVADSTTGAKTEYLQAKDFNYGDPVIWVSKGNCTGFVRWFIYFNNK